MEQRVRLDVPTLADPVVRSLLQESDLFARSFSGSGFGLLSPLDFIRIFSLLTEIVSHAYLIISLTRGVSHLGILLVSILSTMLPLFLSWFSCSREQMEFPASAKEMRAADRQERLRNLAYSDAHRPEIALFGLGDWILKSWSNARKIAIASEQLSYARNTSIIDQFNLSELVCAIQNVSPTHFPSDFRVINHFSASSTTFLPECIYLSGIVDRLPFLDSKHGLRLWEFSHYYQDGIPGYFPNGSIHGEHEIETTAEP